MSSNTLINDGFIRAVLGGKEELNKVRIEITEFISIVGNCLARETDLKKLLPTHVSSIFQPKIEDSKRYTSMRWVIQIERPKQKQLHTGAPRYIIALDASMILGHTDEGEPLIESRVIYTNVHEIEYDEDVKTVRNALEHLLKWLLCSLGPDSHLAREMYVLQKANKHLV